MRNTHLLQIIRKDLDTPQTINKYRFDNYEHAYEDYFAECSIQAKYRGKIKGWTSVTLYEGSTCLKNITIEQL